MPPKASNPKLSANWLKDIVAGRTAIAQVEDRRPLLYRGCDVKQLVEDGVSFERVAFLLIYGELPDDTNGEYERFITVLQSRRRLPPEVDDFVAELAKRLIDPMSIMRTAVSMLGNLDREEMSNTDRALRTKATRLLAQLPTVIGHIHSQQASHKPLQDLDRDSESDFAAHMYLMLTGNAPRPEVSYALNAALVLYAEHGFSASTFAARTIASTHSDLYSAVTGAIGALRGLRHGGANELIASWLLERDDPPKHVAELFANQAKFPGFGHPRLKGPDPRVAILDKVIDKLHQEIRKKPDLARCVSNEDYLDRAKLIVETVKEHYPSNSRGTKKKALHPNLEFPCAVLFLKLEIYRNLFGPIFAVARLAGVSANIIEQARTQRMIRPREEYVGDVPTPVPSSTPRPQTGRPTNIDFKEKEPVASS